MAGILDRFRRFYTPKASIRPGGLAVGNMYMGGANTSPVEYSTSQYLLAFERVGWLYAAVDRISSATAEATWRLYRKPSEAGGKVEEIVQHEVLDLLHHVNPFETWNEHIELSQEFIELTGEVFWVLLRTGRRVDEIWAINPMQMEVLPSRDGYVAGYVYLNGKERIPLEAKDVIHFKRPNPRNRYRGLSPVSSILTDVESQRYSSLWNRNFFRNSAEPGGVIEVDNDINDTEFERLQMQWNEDHRGVSNAHRVAILSGGAKWKDRKVTQREMQFDRLRKENRDIILANYGMPLHILGISETVNRASAEAQEYVFARWVVRPRLVRWRDKLNEQLMPNFDATGQLYLEFDDPVPENQEFRLLRAKEGYRSGYLTRNEARALEGLNPDTGAGDAYFVPVNGVEVPVGQNSPAAAKPTAPLAAEEEAKPRPVAQEQPKALEPPVPIQKDAGASGGVMVGFFLPPEAAAALALDGGEPPEQLHCTVGYFGDAAKFSEVDIAKLIAATATVGSWFPPLLAAVSGLGRFQASESSDGKDVLYASVDAAWLTELRTALLDELGRYGIFQASEHGFTPHITLAYLEPGAPSPIDRVAAISFLVPELTVVVGDRRIPCKLGWEWPVPNIALKELERNPYTVEELRRLDAFDALVDDLSLPILNWMRGLFLAQERDVLRRLRALKALKDAESPEIDVDVLFNLTEWTEVTRKALETLLLQALSTTGAQAATGLGRVFSVDARVESWLGEHTRIYGKAINQTTLQAITDQLVAAHRAGEGIDEMATRIRSVFQEATSWRAETIARTESISAANKGLMESYRQAGIEYKQWLVARDERTDAVCWGNQAAGPIPLDDPFPSGHVAPGAHPNCRCVVQPILEPPTQQRMAKVRCQVCRHLMATNVSDGEFVCTKCKRPDQQVYVIEHGRLVATRPYAPSPATPAK